MADTYLQSISKFHQKCEMLVKISRQYKLLRSHASFPVSDMLICLNSTVQKPIDQIKFLGLESQNLKSI